MKIGYRLTYNEEMKAIEEIEQQIKRKEQKSIERRKKRKIERARQKANKVIYKRAVPIVLTLIAGTAVVANVSINYQEQNKPATVDQVLDNGESLENLKIDSNLLYRLKEIENTLQQSDELDNTQIIRISKRYK